MAGSNGIQYGLKWRFLSDAGYQVPALLVAVSNKPLYKTTPHVYSFQNVCGRHKSFPGRMSDSSFSFSFLFTSLVRTGPCDPPHTRLSIVVFLPFCFFLGWLADGLVWMLACERVSVPDSIPGIRARAALRARRRARLADRSPAFPISHSHFPVPQEAAQ